MPRRLSETRTWLDRVTVHVAWIALYFVVSYVLAVGPQRPSSNYLQTYLHIAILSFDGVIFYLIATLALSRPRRLPLAWSVVCTLALICLVLLHFDYLFHRLVVFTGSGITGPYQRIKEYVIVTQLLLIGALLVAQAESQLTRARRFLPSYWDAAACMLCAAPLINYFLLNTSYFTGLSALEYFALLLGLPLLVLTVTRFVVGLVGYSFNFTPWIAVGAWIIYARPMILGALQTPVEESVGTQLLLIGVLPVIAAIIHSRKPRVLGLLAVFLSSGALIGGQFGGGGTGGGEQATTGHTMPQESREARVDEVPPFVVAPDVYLLVYDAYVHNDVMRQYGIDNSRQVQFLQSKGFRIYPNTYTAHPSSLGTMSRVLDMSLEPREQIGGGNLSNLVFKREGYRRHLVVASYFLQGLSTEPDVDFVYPRLRQRAGVEAIYLGLKAGEFNPGLVFTEHDYGEWLGAKRRVLSMKSAEPKFLYSHSRFPGHSQNSGTCLSNEVEQFAQRLRAANEEMTADVESLLASGRDPIVIIAGDHGPFLTGDCFTLATKRPDQVTAVELADRYGVFLAIRWPEQVSVSDEALTFMPNLFSYVFDQLSGGKYPARLPARTFSFGPSIPTDVIRDGIVTVGVNKGQPLYEAMH